MRKTKTFCIFLLTLLVCSCGKIDRAQTKKEIATRKKLRSLSQEISAVEQKKRDAMNQYLSSLSLEEKICQLFIVNLVGDRAFVPVEKMTDISSDCPPGKPVIPGGYLFFSYNLADSPEDIISFTDSIRSYCIENGFVPPFLAIDQEGGLVNRLKTACGPLPSCERVSAHLTVEQAYRLYSLQAIQMKSLGFSVNMAPVVEICTAENRDFLNGRSFGTAQDVISYSRACINAYENVGVGAVAKHFPGNTNTDPHSGLPEIRLSAEELETMLIPFKNSISARPAGILMSHARTSSVDAGVPACLSHKWVTEILKNQYGFEGVVFSDDIFMGALSKNGFPPEIACVKAIEAGIDCIMISEKRIASPAKVLVERAKRDESFLQRINNAAEKVISLKLKYGLLEYRRSADGSSYTVESAQPFGITEDRLVHFYDARKENCDLYIDNF